MKHIAHADVRRLVMLLGFVGATQLAAPTFGEIVALWHFDEASGSIVARDSIGSYDGTLNGSADFVPGGISGNALSVTIAGDGYVDIGDHLGFTTGDFSLVAWIQMNPGDPGQYMIVGKHASGWVNGYGLSTGAGWGYGQPGKAYFYDSATGGTEPISTTTVNDGAWHQVVGVYTQGGMAAIYVDGAPVEDAKPALTIGGNTGHFLVGGSGAFGTAAPTSAYNGLVDEVRVYDHALTSDEIQDLFEHPGVAGEDCNGNSVPDEQDIADGTSLDCNNNNVPDECDLAIGSNGLFVPVDFSTHHNGSLQANLDPGFPSGDLVLGGVPFSIPTTGNNFWHSQHASGANPRSIDIAVNRAGVWEVHTIINTYWGQLGSYASLEFFGSDEAYFRKDLVGNDDIRDFSQAAWTNNINGVTTINVVAVGSRRLDKQRIALPADFRDETLLTVRMSDNGAENFQRAFLAGITVLVNGSGDCNGNGVPDECDIADGTSTDGNGDTVPDECAPCGWIKWPVSSGGNGHFYHAVTAPGGIHWNDASADAAAAGGYLASIHSTAENSFVYDLIASPEFWGPPDPWGNTAGPWLGGFQVPGSPEPGGGWTWESGEPWTYATWAPFQPDNANGTEHWLHYLGWGVPMSEHWNDAPSNAGRGYIIEREDLPPVADPRSFFDTFEGTTFDPALVDINGAYAIGGGNAWCAGPRSYVRTTASDYNTVDFLMEVTYTMNGGGGAAGVFVGIGSALKDPLYYNEPLHSCYVLDHAQDFPWTEFFVRSLPVSGQPINHFTWASQIDGTHRVRITKRGDAITYQVDEFYAGGDFIADFSGTLSMSGDLPFLNASNSHLFFGTEASPSVFHDMRVSVIPPPTGDCDRDCDVDLLDYGCFFACITGPGGGLLPNCGIFDFDRDLDVDVPDFALFQVGFSGE